MSLLYLGYMVLVSIGIVSLIHVFRISFSAKQIRSAACAIGIMAPVFVFWDVLAVSRGHWSFGLEPTLNVVIHNQPLEEMLFFILIPAFGIVLWELFAKKIKQENRRSGLA